MGAAAAAMIAAAVPERIAGVVCIDMLGPLSKNPAKSAASLRSGMQSRLKLVTRAKAGGGRVYESFEACVAQRLRTVEQLPGTQKLTPDAAAKLVRRAAVQKEEVLC